MPGHKKIGGPPEPGFSDTRGPGVAGAFNSAARAATVGAAQMVAAGKVRSNLSSISINNLKARNAFPPKSKKSSSVRTDFRDRTRSQMEVRTSRVSERDGSTIYEASYRRCASKL